MSFYRLKNADNKIWYIPGHHTRTALELYQPNSPRGRLLKRMFPLLRHFPFLLPYLHATRVEDSDPSLAPILATVHQLINSPTPQLSNPSTHQLKNSSYSIFCGTPSVHRKTTVQFFTGRRILAYAKLSQSDEVAKLFRHEQRLLSALHERGVSDVPKCIGCGRLSSGEHFFLQSTVKSPGAKSPTEWTPLHESFLTDLFDRTATELLFDNSDFAASLFALRDRLPDLPADLRPRIESTLSHVLDSLLGQQVHYAAFHADFTPWNMFIERGKLFVFDWEYGRMTYPAGLDRYHFFIQQAIHVDHLEAEEIARRLQSESWHDLTNLRYYLLDIIARFVTREPTDRPLPPTLRTQLRTWTHLLPA